MHCKGWGTGRRFIYTVPEKGQREWKITLLRFFVKKREWAEMYNVLELIHFYHTTLTASNS